MEKTNFSLGSLILILLLMVFLFNAGFITYAAVQISQENVDAQTNLQVITVDKKRKEISSSIEHDPISINGNDVLNNTAMSGSGTESDPYIIENLIINAKGNDSGISIENTDKYLIIVNCTVFGAIRGIELYNNCTNVHITNCTLTNNAYYGIIMSANLLTNSTITHNEIGVNMGGMDSNTTLKNNIVTHNDLGIQIGDPGRYYCFCTFSDRCRLSNNTIKYNREGISIESSFGNTFINNTITNNSEYGVYLHYSICNTFTNNTVTYNEYGIYEAYYGSGGNTFSNNIVTHNNLHGFYFGFQSGNNKLTNNTIMYNGQCGVSVGSISCNNKFTSNFVKNNGLDGFSLGMEVESNTLTNNTFMHNGRYGIYLSDSFANTIQWNDFIENNPSGSSQAKDDGFYHDKPGVFTYNYWSDHTGPDNDSDGIVDTPYSIDGSKNNTDSYPLTSPSNPSTLTIHFISKPRIIFPNGRESLNGRVKIQWTPGVDSWGHSVTYTVCYSADGGITWIVLEPDLTATSCLWDTTIVADGTNYLIKVNASCPEGSWAVDISDGSFTISNHVPTATTTPSSVISTSIPTTTTSSISTPCWDPLLLLFPFIVIIQLRQHKKRS